MIEILNKIKWVATAFGVFILALGIFSAVKANQKPISFAQLDLNNLKGGTIVEDDVTMNFGTYEEEYDTVFGFQDTSSLIWYYIIPMGDKYMGVSVDANAQGASFDMQAEQTFDYLDGQAVTPMAIKVKGSITKMSEQDKGFFVESLIAGGYSASEAQQVMIPYFIKSNAYSDYYVQLIIGAIAIVLGVGCMIVAKYYE